MIEVRQYVVDRFWRKFIVRDQTKIQFWRKMRDLGMQGKHGIHTKVFNVKKG